MSKPTATDADPCGSASSSSHWIDARPALAANKDKSIAFIFVRAGSRKPLHWLQGVADLMASGAVGSGVHIVQKTELSTHDAQCVRSIRGPVHIHNMPLDAVDAGPKGGRECTGYIYWLRMHLRRLPHSMFFMHESPPAHLMETFASALASPQGFFNLLQPQAAVLRCFAPSTASSDRSLRVNTSPYVLPKSLRQLLGRLGIEPPHCVLTPCCAEFRLLRSALRRADVTPAKLTMIDEYVRGITPPPSEEVDGTTGWGLGGKWLPTRCHAMEHAWHLLFRQPSLLTPLPPRTLRPGRLTATNRWIPPSTKISCAGTHIQSTPTTQRAFGWLTMHLIRALVAGGGGSDNTRCDAQSATCSDGSSLLGSSYGLSRAWNATGRGGGEASDVDSVLLNASAGSLGRVRHAAGLGCSLVL